MRVQLNEIYHLESDPRNWILCKKLIVKPQDPNKPDYIKYDKTYHGTIQQVARKLLNMEALQLDTLNDLMALFEEAEDRLTNKLEVICK